MNETSFAHILFATTVPAKLFDKLGAVSPAKRGVEWPRRACPVLTGRVESFIHPRPPVSEDGLRI